MGGIGVEQVGIGGAGAPGGGLPAGLDTETLRFNVVTGLWESNSILTNDGSNIVTVEAALSPTLRISDTAQSWDIATLFGTGIFIIQDVNTGNFPFSITPGAPTTSLIISATGEVGIGRAPLARLNVLGLGNTSATNSLLVERADTLGLLKIKDDGQVTLPQTFSQLHIGADVAASGPFIVKGHEGGSQLGRISNTDDLRNPLNIHRAAPTIDASDGFGSTILWSMEDNGIAFATMWRESVERDGADTQGYRHFSNGSNAIVFGINKDANIGIGTWARGDYDGTAVNVLAIKNGTEPAAAVAGAIQIGSKDSSDGVVNATLSLTTEQAVEAIGVFTPSHKLKIWINGVEYWMQLDAV